MRIFVEFSVNIRQDKRHYMQGTPLLPALAFFAAKRVSPLRGGECRLGAGFDESVSSVKLKRPA
jgi:hypothetical protein